MRTLLKAGILSSLLLISSTALSKEPESPQPAMKVWGLQLDAGVPAGVGLSLIIRPVRWGYMNFGGAFNGMAPGLFTGATLDPFDWPITLTLTGELGGSFRGKLIGVSDAPDISYVYANLWPGIEFGSRDSARFFIRGGVSWVDGSLYNSDTYLHNSDPSISYSNPHFTAAIAPTGKIGFRMLF